ncbi:hypothetical protein JOF34_000986 [Microbacterium amylolyticum]|uniref:Uncharacterized protein n=1 Tax=Microbacterium amylolyticum TaxID=936337 RepID=A0ABS4ZGJ5_9MICO|nr:hypothetical protein [Microbacterium amylolyticum]
MGRKQGPVTPNEGNPSTGVVLFEVPGRFAGVFPSLGISGRRHRSTHTKVELWAAERRRPPYWYANRILDRKNG